MTPYEARGETVYKTVCRDDTKEGICPKVTRTVPYILLTFTKVNRNEYANCEEECSSGTCVQCTVTMN